ncbi:hypothetical protein H7J86_26300 [Mycobacterium hackensackense]|uniref:hypothetical protein n=1 Tax=Mycobacterium hackensackense TaxID=228909 RepID=UPI002265D199|nr:hypothetical protein [Mycobacterium hackensackense]MCV7255681.1 hypothetical protein [Mycobacterium hackensackense]
MPAFPLGPDDVDLIFRDPVLDGAGQQTVDADGRPVYQDRRITKTRAKFTITGISHTSATGQPAAPVAVYNAKCALPVDADTRALAEKDAIEHDGKVFELLADARVKRTLIDRIEHHVRVFCSREEHTAGIGEQVTITPRGGQDDDGARLPDSEPFTVVATAIDAGNTVERYGAEGTTEEADFTVVLPLGTGIRDGDWILVRGMRCVARIQRHFSQHAERNEDVVLARFRGGGG